MVMISEPLHIVENEPYHGNNSEHYECDKHQQQAGGGHSQLCPVHAPVEHLQMEIGLIIDEGAQLSANRFRANHERNVR